MVALGWADASRVRRAQRRASTRQYQAERLDVDAYIDFATAAWRDAPAAELAAVQRAFHARADAAGDAASARVRWCAAPRRRRPAWPSSPRPTSSSRGRSPALFGVDALIATELERDADGRVTGAHPRRAGVPRRQGRARASNGWPQQGRSAATTSSAAPSTAIRPTTCRCSKRSATRWPPTRARRWSASRASAAGPSSACST